VENGDTASTDNACGQRRLYPDSVSAIESGDVLMSELEFLEESGSNDVEVG
jgi:hypothetical protein